MDWATLGTRIIQAAALAAAVHMAERLRVLPEEEAEALSPRKGPAPGERKET